MVTHADVSQLVLGVRGQDVRQKIPTNVQQLEPWVPLGATDYGFLGRDTDVDLATILVLVQRPHEAVGACQVLRQGPEPYATDCVLAYLDTWGLREVFVSRQTMSQPSRHSSTRFQSGTGREDNGGTESEVLASSRMVRSRMLCEGSRASRLQEKLGYKVDSKSIVLPWLVRHAAYVLSRMCET